MTEREEPFSILVVDDEEVIRSLLRLTLVREGYDVSEAESGEEALDLLQKRSVDLIILDVMMPGLDGFDVCRQIRQQSPAAAAPVLMLSARKDARARQRSKEAGANAYLTKPVKTAELLWHVRRALNAAHTP
jgi:DNA-binding response OmpR family regulator